jgi:hypothetical protein
MVLIMMKVEALNCSYHVIATTIFFNGDVTLGTFFSVGCNPIRCLRIIITFLNPLAQESALHGIVPLFSTFEAKDMPAFASHGSSIDILNLYGVAAVC